MEKILTADQAITLLRARAWTSAAPGLSRTRELLRRLGNPEQKLRYVHITGTNGKGSTAAMLASVLRCAGFRTGLFTSPHLYRFHERIQINGEMISDDALIALTEGVLGASEGMAENPTEFELSTALGFLYFAQQRWDIVVLEVGMGGFLDSTNVIPAPECAVITNIALEHTAILGDTIAKIAHEKSGIIKSGCRAVLYRQSEEAERVVRARCEKEGVPLTVTEPNALVRCDTSLEQQRFSYRGSEIYRLSLLGDYQLGNAMTALDAIASLRQRGFSIEAPAAAQGLSAVHWAGRMELVRRRPDFLIDGAHNPQCAEALTRSLAPLLGGRKAVFLVGVLSDKDWQKMLSLTFPIAKAFVTLTPPSQRAEDGCALAAWLSRKGFPAQFAPSVDTAVQMSIALAGEDGFVCSFGSLYSAGDIRHTFGLC